MPKRKEGFEGQQLPFLSIGNPIHCSPAPSRLQSHFFSYNFSSSIHNHLQLSMAPSQTMRLFGGVRFLATTVAATDDLEFALNLFSDIARELQAQRRESLLTITQCPRSTRRAVRETIHEREPDLARSPHFRHSSSRHPHCHHRRHPSPRPAHRKVLYRPRQRESCLR